MRRLSVAQLIIPAALIELDKDFTVLHTSVRLLPEAFDWTAGQVVAISFVSATLAQEATCL